MDNIIETSGLVKKFGNLKAVDGLTIKIPQGKCFGLLGPNGAGKSTFINMVYGAAKKTAGEIKVFNLDPTTQERAIKKRLGVVTQENALDESLTVKENMLIYAAFVGLSHPEREKRVLELLHYMSLEQKSDAKIQELSGGMRRRLVFVRALLNDPEFLILDEPTTGLDPAVRHLLWSKVRELKAKGRSILLTTHYMHEAEVLCDELAIMDRAQIVAQGSPQELISKFTPGYVSMFGADRSDFVEKSVNDKSTFFFYKDSTGGYLRAPALEDLIKFNNDFGVTPLQMRPANLEDVFLEITGHGLAHNA